MSKLFIARENEVVEKFYADFMHVKDGIICLYNRQGSELPKIVAAFNKYTTVYEEEDDET